MAIDFRQVAIDSHRLAVEKGWWDGPPRSREMLQLLILSEISEAVEEMRKVDFVPNAIYYSDNGKPEGFAVEVADAIIRAGDAVLGLGERLGAGPAVIGNRKNIDRYEAGCQGYPADDDLPEGALLSASHCFSNRLATDQLWGYGVAHLVTACLKLGAPLEQALMEKMAYNTKRSYRHGGLRA